MSCAQDKEILYAKLYVCTTLAVLKQKGGCKAAQLNNKEREGIV